MGRRNKTETLRRYAEEDLLACLLLMETDLDELTVRIRQAMRRTELVRPVLEPALERLAELRRTIEQSHDALRQRGDE